MQTADEPHRLTSCLGAVGLLVAAGSATIGLLSIGSAPLQAVGLLAVACAGAGLFLRAWLADRRWRRVQRATIHPHAPAGRSMARYIASADEARKPSGRFGHALRMFLDDPDGLGSLTIDGPGTFYLRFALDPVDPNTLAAKAVAISRLEPSLRPQEDAWLGLVAIGWAAPEPVAYREAGVGATPREEFAAEWHLPIAIDEIDGFIQSTARIYGIDERLLRSRFATGRPVPDGPESAVGSGAEAPAPWDPYVTLKRWDRQPAAKFLWLALLVLIVVGGRDRFDELLHSIPNVLVSGAIAALCFVFAIHLLLRYRRTSDPFSVTGWNWLHQREVTRYQGHVWWGIFGVLAALAGLFFAIQALPGIGA